ncbi:DHHC palmitoyltransferase-domain-containing protein [Protomyces lactucae-debilis]|uniref:Palmitoyltransferase n=1 Tax=Protomyces lactucae-debilis TaxID=2754530 RepID=A0A1Y2FH52_PROLT|nr:DHHC palmitoyltransferase-domain-containing protein [Protomyces lactucae-debilis]ORY83278.1 DHHC palmitoyltransferase-domain-containing protein [Protomyces lactucae-debilis]
MAWSFFRVLLTPAGYLPNASDRARAAGVDPERHGEQGSAPNEDDKVYGKRPTAKEVRAFLQTQPLASQPTWIARNDATDGTRYCGICEVTKYDRVHHCSEVNRCVKKFDHFCPWVGGALGHTRYKFFFQFVTYVAIYSVLLVVTFAVAVGQRKAAIRRNDGTSIPHNVGLWYSCIALGGLFALMMIPFSFFHGRQILLNLTTLESIAAHDITVIHQTERTTPSGEKVPIKERVTLSSGVNPFDLGLWRNWQQVMGEFKADRWVVLRVLNWILPIQQSPGDGLLYPWNPAVLEELARRDTQLSVTLLSESTQTAMDNEEATRAQEKLAAASPQT